jgi:hypothetical protein
MVELVALCQAVSWACWRLRPVGLVTAWFRGSMLMLTLLSRCTCSLGLPRHFEYGFANGTAGCWHDQLLMIGSNYFMGMVDVCSVLPMARLGGGTRIPVRLLHLA